MDVQGACRLCFESGPLRDGHVVPAFVFRWLKKTAATPYLVGRDNPNLRLQDGLKRYWFCPPCEQFIGRFERAVERKLFTRIVAEMPVPYSYGPWLSRFAASVAWRTLALYSEYGDSFDYFNQEQRQLVPAALESWRAFTRGEASTPGIHELHFLTVGLMEGYQGPTKPPPNINRYLARVVDTHVASTRDEAFTFTKMGPMVVLGFIMPPARPEWVGTMLAHGDAEIGKYSVVPSYFVRYLFDRAKDVLAVIRMRSPHRTNIVGETMLANPERARASDTIRAMNADVDMFGADHVFGPADEDAEASAPDSESKGGDVPEL